MYLHQKVSTSFQPLGGSTQAVIDYNFRNQFILNFQKDWQGPQVIISKAPCVQVNRQNVDLLFSYPLSVLQIYLAYAF